MLTVSFAKRVLIFTAPLLVWGCGPGTVSDTTALNTSPSTPVTAPTSLAYSASFKIYTQSESIDASTPHVTGGAITHYTISPALPAGLRIDENSGEISGTPTALSPITQYAVTGTNAAGRVDTALVIAVTAAGSWITVAPPTTPHLGGTATLLNDGTVLVAGGVATLDTPVTPTAVAEIYTPATNKWSAVNAMSTPRQSHTATRLQDGTVLVVGGYATATGNTALATGEMYDPATQSWRTVGNLNQARAFHTATLLNDGTLLVAGGFGGSVFFPLDSAEIYNPTTGIWTATGTMLVADALHTATLLQNNKVLVAGSKGELYDPSLGTWSATGAMITPRTQLAAALQQNGDVLITGGVDGNNTTLASAERYDPLANSWTAVNPMASARLYHSATTLADGTILVAGGDTGGTAGTSAERYSPSTGNWTTTGSLAVAREAAPTLRLPSGQVLSVGTDAEIYAP